MNCEVLSLFSPVASSRLCVCCLLSQSQMPTTPSRLCIARDEGGQLGLHGCGTEQLGGFSRSQTVIRFLRDKHPPC